MNNSNEWFCLCCRPANPSNINIIFSHRPIMSCVYDADASDWDSASTASRRTLPGSREQFPECIYPSVKEQDEEAVPAAPLTPERSINSHKTMPTTPQQPGPQPQPQPLPRARKMVLQKAESEGGEAHQDQHCRIQNLITNGPFLKSLYRNSSHYFSFFPFSLSFRIRFGARQC